MLKVLKILVTAHALVGGAAMLTACGQKGPLFLPNNPESAARATLPQTLRPWSASAPSSAPAAAPTPPATDTSAPQIAPAATPAAPTAPAQ